MKFEKYVTKSGITKWKFYHYLGINPDTGKPDEVRKRGYKTQAQARAALTKIIRDYEEEQIISTSRKDFYRFEEVTDL